MERSKEENTFPYRVSNPGRLGENQESWTLDHMGTAYKGWASGLLSMCLAGVRSVLSGGLWLFTSDFINVRIISQDENHPEGSWDRWQYRGEKQRGACLPIPGVKPGPPGWKPGILTARPYGNCLQAMGFWATFNVRGGCELRVV